MIRKKKFEKFSFVYFLKEKNFKFADEHFK